MRLDHLLSKEHFNMHCSVFFAQCDKEKRGYSSVGRAPALHAGGQEFESPYLHHGKRAMGDDVP